LLRSLLADLKKAKDEWMVRYEQATTANEQYMAIRRVNENADAIRYYTKLLNIGAA
jgi:hypothetical protein